MFGGSCKQWLYIGCMVASIHSACTGPQPMLLVFIFVQREAQMCIETRRSVAAGSVSSIAIVGARTALKLALSVLRTGFFALGG